MGDVKEKPEEPQKSDPPILDAGIDLATEVVPKTPSSGTADVNDTTVVGTDTRRNLTIPPAQLAAANDILSSTNDLQIIETQGAGSSTWAYRALARLWGQRTADQNTNATIEVKKYPVNSEQVDRVMSVAGQTGNTTVTRNAEGHITELKTPDKHYSLGENGRWIVTNNQGQILGADGRPVMVNGNPVLRTAANASDFSQNLAVLDTTRMGIFNIVNLDSRSVLKFDARTGQELLQNVESNSVNSRVKATGGNVEEIQRTNGETVLVSRDPSTQDIQELRVRPRGGPTDGSQDAVWKKEGNQWRIGDRLVTGNVTVTGDGTITITDTANNTRTSIGVDGRQEIRQISASGTEIPFSIVTGGPRGEIQQLIYRNQPYTAENGLRTDERGNPYIEIPEAPGDRQTGSGGVTRITFDLRNGTRTEVSRNGTSIIDNGGRLLQRYKPGDVPGAPGVRPIESYKYAQTSDGRYRVVEFSNGNGVYTFAGRQEGGYDVWNQPGGGEMIGNVSIMENGDIKFEREGPRGKETTIRTLSGLTIESDARGNRVVKDRDGNEVNSVTQGENGTIVRIQGGPPNGSAYRYEAPSQQHPQGRYYEVGADGKEGQAINGRITILEDGAIKIENSDNRSITRIDIRGESTTTFLRNSATIVRDRTGNITQTDDGRGNIRRYGYDLDPATNQARLIRVSEGDPANGGQTWSLQADGTWKSSIGTIFRGTISVDRVTGNRLMEDKDTKTLTTENIADGSVRNESLETPFTQILRNDQVSESQDNRGQVTQFYHGPNGSIDALINMDGTIVLRAGVNYADVAARDERFPREMPNNVQRVRDIILTDNRVITQSEDGTRQTERDLRTGGTYIYELSNGVRGRLTEANIPVGGFGRPVEFHHFKRNDDPSIRSEFVGRIGETGPWSAASISGDGIIRMTVPSASQDWEHRPDGSYTIIDHGRQRRTFDTMSRLKESIDLQTRIVHSIEYNGPNTLPFRIRVLNGSTNSETVFERINEGTENPQGGRIYQFRNMTTNQVFQGPVSFENDQLVFMNESTTSTSIEGSNHRISHLDGTQYVRQGGPEGQILRWKPANGQEVVFGNDGGVLNSGYFANTTIRHNGQNWTVQGTPTVSGNGFLTYRAVNANGDEVTFTHDRNGLVRGRLEKPGTGTTLNVGDLMIANGPGGAAPAVVGNDLFRLGKVTAIVPDAASGGFKVTLENGMTGILQKDGSYRFTHTAGDTTRNVIVSADGRTTREFQTGKEPRIERTPSGLEVVVPDSYTETTRDHRGEEVVTHWRRRADGTWESSNTADFANINQHFVGTRGFLKGTGELITRRDVPANQTNGTEALQHWELYENNGGRRDMYYTPQGVYRYSASYDTNRRLVMTDNPQERISFTYNEAGVPTTVTIVDKQSNRSVIYTRAQDGLYRSAENPQGLKIEVDSLGGVSWSSPDGSNKVTVLPNGSQIHANGVRIDVRPDDSVRQRIYQIDSDRNRVPGSPVIEVRTDGNIIYNNGAGVTYSYNPDAGRVTVTEGGNTRSFRGRITVDDKGNASIFNEQTDRLEVVNVLNSTPQVLERRISQTFSDGSSVTAVGGNQLLYKTADGREITLTGTMDMVNDRPVINLTELGDYQRLQQFIDAGRTASGVIRLANGATVQASPSEAGKLLYSFEGRTVTVDGTIDHTGNINLTGSNIPPDIAAAVTRIDTGLPIGRRILLTNGATVTSDPNNGNALIYTHNGVSTPINGTIDPQSGRIQFREAGLPADIVGALKAPGQREQLYWSRLDGVFEAQYVSSDVIFDAQRNYTPNEAGGIKFEIAPGTTLEFNPAKPGELILREGEKTTVVPGTVRFDSQGNARIVLTSGGTATVPAAVLQALQGANGLRLVSSGHPPSRVDLTSIGAPPVGLNRNQMGTEVINAGSYRPQAATAPIAGIGVTNLNSVGAPLAATRVNTAETAEVPEANRVPGRLPFAHARTVNGPPEIPPTATEVRLEQARVQETAAVQEATNLQRRIEETMIRHNLPQADREALRAAMLANNLTPTAATPPALAAAMKDVADVIRGSSIYTPERGGSAALVAAMDRIKLAAEVTRVLSQSVSHPDALRAFERLRDGASIEDLRNQVPPHALPLLERLARLNQADRANVIDSVANRIRSGEGLDHNAGLAAQRREQLLRQVFSNSRSIQEGEQQAQRVNQLVELEQSLQRRERSVAAELERLKTTNASSERIQQAERDLAAIRQDLINKVLREELKLLLPDSVKSALSQFANQPNAQRILDEIRRSVERGVNNLPPDQLLRMLQAVRAEQQLELARAGDQNFVRQVPQEVRDIASQLASNAINMAAREYAIDAAVAHQMMRSIEAAVLQSVRFSVMHRSALDFLPNFVLTGDLSGLSSGANAKQFATPLTTLPIDLNTRVSAYTGRGTTNVIAADGSIISIERALANPTLLAALLASNQIGINTLNGLLASADITRILSLALPGNLAYTQLINPCNPDMLKYFTTNVDGINKGFNIQLGIAGGLVYTSQNGVLVPARLNALEDGVFINSLQGQKSLTEAIKCNSQFVTISTSKGRLDDEDDEDEEEDDVVVSSGNKEDFGGKIPTALPQQQQPAASQDPTAVLASQQPVPLPDFLIFPDGSMEPMPADWKTRANQEHGHVDVIDEKGKCVHVIDAKGNVLSEAEIQRAKEMKAAAKRAEAAGLNTSSDFSPLSPHASLNAPLQTSDNMDLSTVNNVGVGMGMDLDLSAMMDLGSITGDQSQGAYIDNDVSEDLAFLQGLPLDPTTGFPYDPTTGYLLNPNNGDIIGSINDHAAQALSSVNPFEGRMIDPETGYPYDPATGIMYDPLTGNPVGTMSNASYAGFQNSMSDLTNDIAMIQDDMETRLDDISAYSHVQDALSHEDANDLPHDVVSDLATRPEAMDFGTDDDYKAKEKERLDNILNQIEEEEKRLEEQEEELKRRREEIERLTKLMNSLLATRRQAELDRIRRLIEQQKKIEEFIAKDIRRIKYVVRKGDTLESIAKKHFRDPRLARLIYEMNPAHIRKSQDEGKSAYELSVGSTLTLPSPRQAREWISRGKYLTAVDNNFVAQSELSSDDLASIEKRRINVENVLGALGMAADSNYKPNYTVRFGDSLRSIAMKHPALNDVSLWRLLAKVNNISVETDAMGTPKASLERGISLILPSKEEIAQFRKDNGALVHPSSLKGVSPDADFVTNVTVFKECPSCKENTPSGVCLCHKCGHVFQESADGIGTSTNTKISTVANQVSLTGEIASTRHDPLAPMPNQDSEDNVHTLELPAKERKVANSDVTPLVKTEVDPHGVPNVSHAAKAAITQKLNDPMQQSADEALSGRTGHTSESFSNSLSSMQKARKDASSNKNIPSRQFNMSKLVEALSESSRIVLLDAQTVAGADRAERWQLEVMKDGDWTPVVAYEIVGDRSTRHEYNINGKAKKSIKMELPPSAVEEMVRNDLSRNWQDYCQKFLAGKKISQ